MRSMVRSFVGTALLAGIATGAFVWFNGKLVGREGCAADGFASLFTAPKSAPLVNWLGMKFGPVSGMDVWEMCQDWRDEHREIRVVRSHS